MSVRYTGETDLKIKIEEIINEMLDDNDLTYTIKINESRENEKITKFVLEVTNIENSMPDF